MARPAKPWYWKERDAGGTRCITTRGFSSPKVKPAVRDWHQISWSFGVTISLPPSRTTGVSHGVQAPSPSRPCLPLPRLPTRSAKRHHQGAPGHQSTDRHSGREVAAAVRRVLGDGLRSGRDRTVGGHHRVESHDDPPGAEGIPATGGHRHLPHSEARRGPQADRKKNSPTSWKRWTSCSKTRPQATR